MACGAVFLGGLAATLLCLPLIRGGVHDFLQHQFSLAPGTLFTAVWKDVPMTPKIEVYVFNVTNHEAYLSGREGKLSVAEIGPFVYHAKQTKDVEGYSADGEEITFKSMTSYRGPIQMQKCWLEFWLEIWLEISYTGKSPKVGSLDMSQNQKVISSQFSSQISSQKFAL